VVVVAFRGHPIPICLPRRDGGMAYHVVVSLIGHHEGASASLTTCRPNFGRGRRVPPEDSWSLLSWFRGAVHVRSTAGNRPTNGPVFHESVRFRINELDYNPRARYTKGTETYES
jgi:hypothetical protein